jgi:hypothetical protein
VQQFDTTPADATEPSQAEAFSTSGVGAPARRFLPPADQKVGKLFAGFDPNPQTAIPNTAGYPVEIPNNIPDPDYDPDFVACAALSQADKKRLRIATEQARPYAVVIDDPPRPPLMADDISRSLEVPSESLMNADIPSDYIPQPINLTPTPEKVYVPPPRFDVTKFDFAAFVRQRCEDISRALGIGISSLHAAKDEFAKLDIPRAEIGKLPEGWETVPNLKVTPLPTPEPFRIERNGKIAITGRLGDEASTALRQYLEVVEAECESRLQQFEGVSAAELGQKVLDETRDGPSIDPRHGVILPVGLILRLAEAAVQASAAAPEQASPGEPIKVPAPNCRQVSLELHVKVHALERPEGGDAEPFLPLYALRGASIRVPDTSLSSLYDLLNAIGSDPDSRGLRGQLAVIEDAIDDLAADGEAFLADDVVEFYEDDWTKPTDFDATLEPATPQTVGACCGNACKGEIPPIDLSTLATARDLSDGALRARDGAE